MTLKTIIVIAVLALVWLQQAIWKVLDIREARKREDRLHALLEEAIKNTGKRSVVEIPIETVKPGVDVWGTKYTDGVNNG